MNEDELLAQLKALARREFAPSELGGRVLEQVAYRARLEDASRDQPHGRWHRSLAGLGAVGIAATVWLWLRAPQPAPRIAAEQTKRVASSATAGPPSSALPPPLTKPCRASGVAAGNAPLIDDFEDGDDALAPLEQRAGFWRWARESDAPGTAPALLPVPRPDAKARNRLALHVKGAQLYDWGATLEASFQPPCYDASRYTGIRLSARGPGRVYVSLREVGVIPGFEGGTCERDCYNSHAAKLELGRDWRSYQVRWVELRQRGIGKPLLDPSQLHSVAFLIRPEDTPYDVWVDDVRFMTEEQ